jgi:hypothetical protein
MSFPRQPSRHRPRADAEHPLCVYLPALRTAYSECAMIGEFIRTINRASALANCDFANSSRARDDGLE